MTRISAFTGGFSGYRTVSRSFAALGSGSEYSGSTMLFVQSSAPTGWVQDTTINDYALRITSGTVGTGGSVNFSSVFTSVTPTGTTSSCTLGAATDATILTSLHIPSHNHTYPSNGPSSISYPGTGNRSPFDDGATSSDVTGGAGSGHAHPSGGTLTTNFTGNSINMAVKYLDCILATRS